MRRAAVYVGLDRDDEVIYIGSGYHPERRWADHAAKPWGCHVHRWATIARCPNRAAAYAIERRLIRELRPWANRADNPTSPLWGRLRHLARRTR